MSVTAAQGFTAAGVAAGLKASGAKDVALVRNIGPRHEAAGVFTSNRITAAPVVWSRTTLQEPRLEAVVLNSGGANACTGGPGYQDSVATAEKVADVLGAAANDVAVCSTGLIGIRLPMDALLAGIDAAAAGLSVEGATDAAEAIMTTDSHPKQASRTVDGWTIGGMAKGAGMLAPGLATMLVVLTTDAVVEADALQHALAESARVTFDRLDSDGCMSTNDTVLLMSSGASGRAPEADAFAGVLTEVCHDLAQQLLADAEGASHDIAVVVRNAATEDEAVTVARSVTGSNLFKCAMFGADPNWGRVLSALGTTDAAYEPDEVDVSFNGVMVCRGGAIGDDRDLVDLSGREVEVLIDLHAGSAQATVWTNDLTYDYVKENAEYSS